MNLDKDALKFVVLFWLLMITIALVAFGVLVGCVTHPKIGLSLLGLIFFTVSSIGIYYEQRR